jgi:hypothetical protein
VRHLDRVLHRAKSLLFKAGGAAVPELRRVIGGVDDRRGLPAAFLATDAFGKLAGSGEPGLRGVARGASDGLVDRKHRVVIEALAQRDCLSRRRIVVRDWHRRKAERWRDLYGGADGSRGQRRLRLRLGSGTAARSEHQNGAQRQGGK